MPTTSIQTLDEDKISVQNDVVQISEDNILAGTTVNILPQSVATTLSNQGNNIPAPGNASVGGTQQGVLLNAGADTRVTPLGAEANAGPIVTIGTNTQKLPNIFFNFRQKTFPNTQNLLFKFETSNLGSGNFTGAKLSTWAANQTISPNISLINAADNPLSVVKAYDKYFYQLDRYKAISNTITLPIKTNPSYTVLVYAVGKASGTTDIINEANAVHSFYDSTNTNQLQNYNIGAITTTKQNQVYLYSPTASFIGNTLNSQVYSDNNTDARLDYENFVNIRNDLFYFRGKYPNFNPFEMFKNKKSSQIYNNIPFANISSFKNNISSPATAVPFVLNTIPGANPPGTVVPINLDTFSLYFVEMFSGITSVDKDNNILTLQTFVNGMLTYDGSMKLKKTAPINSFGTFKIILSNLYGGYNTDANVKLFLFDYLHGVSNSSFSQMKLETRNITESLVYDYRNIILKSTSDIQLSGNINNVSTSLGFYPALVHPFLNMFFTKKT